MADSTNSTTNKPELRRSQRIKLSHLKSSISQITTLDNDIIFSEILPRLPVKSLSRFKCVSKPFKIVISSRDFVKLYLRHSSSSILTLPKNNCILCYDIDSSTPTATTTETITWRNVNSVSVIGSACGLLCISTYSLGSYLSIFNPVTRMCVDIYNGTRLGANLGFAFDPDNLDFKIVGVTDKHSDIKTRTTRVYSLNTRSTMELEITFPDDIIEGRYQGGVLTDKHLLHWMFWKSSLLKWKIGCFDVCKNKWVDDVLLPRYYYNPSDPDLKNFLLDIGVLDECLFSSFENQAESCYDAWVMKEHGVQDSWVKLFSIPVSVDLQPGVVPIACRGESGEILLRKRHSSRLLWYNRKNGGITEAKFDGAPDISKLQVIMCNKTQVDIPRGKLFRN